MSALGEKDSRQKERAAFQARAGWEGAETQEIQGDASPRRYFRLSLKQKTAILMDWRLPQKTQKTQKPQKNQSPRHVGGDDYGRKVRLTSRLSAFIAVGEHLRRLHLHAPQIYAADKERRFLLLEDLGDLTYETLRDDASKSEEFYREAVDVLCAIHEGGAPRELRFEWNFDKKRESNPSAGAHRIPILDDAILLEEVALFPKYFLHGSPKLEQEWREVWKGVLKQMDWSDTALLLRDYHTPNLLWCPRESSPRRIGILDYQDAILGPQHYDLVSLLQDARIDVPQTREEAMLQRYQEAAGVTGKKPRAAFMRNYRIFGAQRAFRILGLFTRLKERDSKPHYMNHAPRLLLYLKRNLEHDALLPLKAWLRHHAPHIFDERNL